MKERIETLLNYLIELYLRNEEQQLIFPKFIILALSIQQSLLSLSYIYELNTFSYVGVLSAFARPQQFLPQYQAIQYIVLLFCILYVLNLFSITSHTKYIGIFGQLLRCSLINFLFEYSTGQMSLVTHSFTLFISLSETLILQGTLNAKTINFQNTRFSFLDLTLILLNYALMILYSYKFSSSIIKILAFLINLLRLLHQLIFSPYKNLVTKILLLTIQIATIYLSIMRIYRFENSFTSEIVLLPLIYNILRVYYLKLFQTNITNKQNCQTIKVLIFLENIKNFKELKIEKPKIARDIIIYTSLLMLQDHHYEAFLELLNIKHSDLNFLQRFKKKVIMKQCMNKIDNKIQIESSTQNKLSFAVQSLMTSEQSNYTIQREIVNILKEKIKFQQLLLQSQTLNVYKQYLIFIGKLLKIKKKLEEQYENFPCDKTQGILGFFYIEIMNDYLAGNSLFSIAAMSDEKLKRIVINQDIFSSKMIYIISTFDGNLTIKRISNDAPEFLQKPNEQLIGKQMAQLIPPGIAEHHDRMIFSFLQDGQSKFFRKFNQNYLFYNNEKTMESIEFTFDIDLRNDFSFISVIQPATSQLMSIVVNSQQKITCISKALITQLGLQFQFKNYIGMTIKIILPNFSPMILGQHFIENTEAYFPNFEDVIYKSASSQSTSVYLTSYTTQSYYFNGQVCYSIITFEYFKKPINLQGNLSVSGSRRLKTTSQEDSIDYDLMINIESKARIPYQENSQKRITSSFYKIPPIYDKQGVNFQNDLKLSSLQDNTNLVSPNNEEYNQLLKEQLYYSQPKNQETKAKMSVKAEKYSQEREVEVYQDDRQSQISSLQGVRKSKFYKKYEIFTKICEQETFTINHQIFILMLSCFISVQLVVQIIQLVEINHNLINLVSDIDLLQIKNLVFGPMETFLVTRYTILNYFWLKEANTITLSSYSELIKFPRSNLNMGYDMLNQNLKQVFNRPELQDFLENTYLDVYSYSGTKIPGEVYNVSLRNSINVLLNYQYTFKMAYMIDGAAPADTPYSYYSYKNYLPIKQLFSELNDFVLHQSIARAHYIEQFMRTVFIICICGLLLFIILALYQFIKITKNVNKYYQLMHNIPIEYIDYDQIRLKLLFERINKDQTSLFKYQFHIDQKETQLENTNPKATQVRRHNEKLPTINSHDICYYLFIVGVIILISGNALLTFNEGMSFLAKYPETAKLYKAVSDIGTDIPTMYAQRDVLYGRVNLWYYNQTEFNQILDEIKDAVLRTTEFLSLDYDFKNFLVSQSFQNLFEKIQNSNLCKYLPNDLLSKSSDLCPLVMSENMQRGLKPVLVYIINFINTDMVINEFTVKTQPIYLVLEGAFLVSSIIAVINNEFNIDLTNQTIQYINSINVHNILILTLLFLIIIILITVIKGKLVKKYYVVKRLIYILPIKTLFLDNAFERNVRQVLQQH